MPKPIQTAEASGGPVAGLIELSPSSNTAVEIDLLSFAPSPFEPQARRRVKFDEDELRQLGQSIKQHGLAQPIVARIINAPGKPLEIVFGERRWLASRFAGLKTILCFVREYDDAKVVELQYEENHKRQKNDPLDDAYYFLFLQDKKGYTNDELADRLNTTARDVRDKLRLNDLIDTAKMELSDDRLPLKHAYYLAKFPADTQRAIVDLQLAYKYHDRTEKAVSYEVFREEVEETIVRRLQNAPFDRADPRLHVRGLLCANCPDNSAHNQYLFPEYASDASCLNKSCFEVKTNTFLRLQREAIAAQLPNPKGAPVEEIVREVPLVTTRQYPSERTPFREKVLTNQTLLEKPECEFSELSLIVEGERKGQQTYICKNKDCPVHHPQPATRSGNELSEDEIEQLEGNFNFQVAYWTRIEILRAAMQYFNESRTFWQFDDLIKNLLVEVLYAMTELQDEIFHVVETWENAPTDLKNFGDKDRLRKFVAALDKGQQSQLMFLLSVSGTEDLEILKIAADYTKINFLRLDAETRLKLAPEEFKPVAAKYLEAVENEQPTVVPSFWRNYDDLEVISDEEN